MQPNRARLEFLENLVQPFHKMGANGYWIYTGFRTKQQSVNKNEFCEMFMLDATQPDDGSVAGTFVLETGYKRVHTHFSVPARIFSRETVPLTESFDFWRSIETLMYKPAGTSSATHTLWTAESRAKKWAHFYMGHHSSEYVRMSAMVPEIYECLMVLLLERPSNHTDIVRCFDMPRVWLAHGQQFTSVETLSIHCTDATKRDFFQEYELLARAYPPNTAAGFACKKLVLQNLSCAVTAKLASTFFVNCVDVKFTCCTLAVANAFLRQSPRVERIYIDTGRQIGGVTDDDLAHFENVAFIETCMQHPALIRVDAFRGADSYGWLVEYLTQCLHDRKAVGTLIEMDVPRLDEELQAQPGTPAPAGVQSFFRHPCFERNVLSIIRGFAGPPSDASALITAIATSTRIEEHQRPPGFQWHPQREPQYHEFSYRWRPSGTFISQVPRSQHFGWNMGP